MKNQKGITLIALVITIIVLLILAGISIATLTGKNGILTQAGNAKEQTEIGSEKETVEIAELAVSMADRGNNITKSNLQKELDKLTGENETEVIEDDKDFIVKFIKSDRYYKVDNRGTVNGPIEIKLDSTPGELDGLGTEENPYVIMSIEDLVSFSQKVNDGTYQENYKYVILGKTLNFKSKFSYCDYTTTQYDTYLGGDGTTGLMEQLSENGKGFKPISVSGYMTAFNGTFDGKGYEIENIFIKKEGDAGLFENTDKYACTIKNLGISGNVTSTFGIAGGICAIPKGTIENCYNKCNVTATVSSDYQGVGGIVGNASADLSIVNCYNAGTINLIDYKGLTNSIGAGGIIGQFRGSGTLNVNNCYNIGTIESKGAAGGILGSKWYEGNVNVVNCYNIGKMNTGWRYHIACMTGFGSSLSMNNCYYLLTEWTGQNEASASDYIISFKDIKNENIAKKLNDYIEENSESCNGWFKWEYNANNNLILKKTAK